MQFEGTDETAENGEYEGGKSGRPIGSTKLQPDERTLKEVQSLARLQCTQREAAAVLGVCENTFRYFLQSHEKAREAWDHGGETGKASLRRYQYKMAETNPTMAIWLGKQWLDQTDKNDTTLRGHDGGAVQFSVLSGVPRADEKPEGEAE